MNTHAPDQGSRAQEYQIEDYARQKQVEEVNCLHCQENADRLVARDEHARIPMEGFPDTVWNTFKMNGCEDQGTQNDSRHGLRRGVEHAQHHPAENRFLKPANDQPAQ